MFTCYFLKKTYSRYAYCFIPLLIFLDLLSSFYTGKVEHITIRHLFIAHDLVSAFANVLFWILLYIPIALDILQERSGFGINIFSRTPKIRYALKKYYSLLIYCAIYFIISMLISTINCLIFQYPFSSLSSITSLYLILVMISFVFILIIYLIVWICDSIYFATVVYAGILVACQIPYLQEKYTLSILQKNTFRSVVILFLISIILISAILLTISKKDLIGIKKGNSL